MARFKIENFGGEIPAVDNRLLPDNHASESVNTWLLSGRIEPVHSLVALKTLSDTSRSFFRLPIASPSVDNMIDSYWLEFENPYVRVISSPVTGQDDDGRYYWADGVYPKYMTGTMIKQVNATPMGEWAIATAYNENDGVTFGGISYVALTSNTGQQPNLSPSFWIITPTPYKLGIPLPTVPPGVTPDGSGVSTINQVRAYTYTWVSGLGEEGPPVPPTLATGKIDDVWNLTFTAPTLAQAEHRNLTHTRIYRSVTSAQGIASFFLVDEIPITTLTYADTKTDAEITLNEQMASLHWTEPPADLQGLVSMPNGMIAAWRMNEVWFCEPYRPHAWPLQYMIAVPNNIVGLGVLGQTLMILTQGSPWSATGIEPSAMALAIIQPLEPCTSRLSIVNTPNGVIYSSPNGLINITSGGAQNLTASMLLKDQWAKTLNLDSVAAAVLMQSYYAFSITQSEVFQLPGDAVFNAFQFNDPVTVPPSEPAFQAESHFGTRPGMFLSFADQRVAKTTLDPETAEVQNIVTDIFNGEVMTLRDGVVYLVDVRLQQPYSKYRWRSKMFRTQYLSNMGAAKVYWTPANIPGDMTIFRMYAAETSQQMEDGLWFRFEQPLEKSGQMFRLPSGYKALYWQFEIEGYAIIDAIHVASTARELREI